MSDIVIDITPVVTEVSFDISPTVPEVVFDIDVPFGGSSAPEVRSVYAIIDFDLPPDIVAFITAPQPSPWPYMAAIINQTTDPSLNGIWQNMTGAPDTEGDQPLAKIAELPEGEAVIAAQFAIQTPDDLMAPKEGGWVYAQVWKESGWGWDLVSSPDAADAADHTFTPFNEDDWAEEPNTVKRALDELAARKGGLAGFVQIFPSDGVADVAASVEAGTITVAIVFLTTDPVEIKLPTASGTQGPMFVMVFVRVAEPSAITYTMDGSSTTFTPQGAIDYGAAVGTLFPMNAWLMGPGSDGLGGYSWGGYPTGIPSAADVGADPEGSAQAVADSLGTAAAANTEDFASSDHSHPASSISVDASGFTNNLTTGDDTVQKVAVKVDTLSAGGYSSAFLLGGM